MNVTVMSRDQVIEYCKMEHDTPAVIISISDPYREYYSEPFRTKRNNVLAIQRLSFSDADKPGKDVYGRDAAEGDLMSDGDALLIKRLLDTYPDTDVIVHCDAGISRSAGVAAAILKAKTNDDSSIFNHYRYRPNMRCYRKTLNVLMSED